MSEIIIGSKKFTEKQLQDFAKPKEVITCEPKRINEKLGIDTLGNTKICMVVPKYDYVADMLLPQISAPICGTGDTVHAMNEKAERQWFCPICESVLVVNDEWSSHNIYCKCVKNNLQKHIHFQWNNITEEEDLFPKTESLTAEGWLPLIVRLCEIKEQKEAHHVDKNGWSFKLPLWLKTWRRSI